MAVGTGPARRVAARMAGSAVVIRPTVPRRERVVKGSARERVRIVTIRTLPRKMIRRRGVAGSTVRQTRVVKAGIFEVACILVAGAACPRKMVGRRTVTGRTILPANR